MEPRERFEERITIRARPSQLRRLETAARLAGVSRSRILRDGGMRVAREIIQEAAGESETND